MRLVAEPTGVALGFAQKGDRIGEVAAWPTCGRADPDFEMQLGESLAAEMFAAFRSALAGGGDLLPSADMGAPRQRRGRVQVLVEGIGVGRESRRLWRMAQNKADAADARAVTATLHLAIRDGEQRRADRDRNVDAIMDGIARRADAAIAARARMEAGTYGVTAVRKIAALGLLVPFESAAERRAMTETAAAAAHAAAVHSAHAAALREQHRIIGICGLRRRCSDDTQREQRK